LYKLVTKDVSEFGWVNDEVFYVWVSHFELSNFIKDIIKIFDDGMFDENTIEAHISKDYIVIDLADMLSGEDIDFKRVFQKDEFKH
jgi:hypothetical protein